ncbi:MAG: VOC family protein [Haloarculaceae archaeon]
METTAIDHVNLSFPADRLSEVVDFYVDALGFTTRFDDPHAAVADDPGLFRIDLGDTYQLFVNPSDGFDPDVTNYRHVALRIPQSPGAVETHLADSGVNVDRSVERESNALGADTSYYVTDPFGYTVELMAVGSPSDRSASERALDIEV